MFLMGIVGHYNEQSFLRNQTNRLPMHGYCVQSAGQGAGELVESLTMMRRYFIFYFFNYEDNRQSCPSEITLERK